eukprot:8829237-Pyramimonas_sp.AAC.1
MAGLPEPIKWEADGDSAPSFVSYRLAPGAGLVQLSTAPSIVKHRRYIATRIVTVMFDKGFKRLVERT